MAAELVGGPGDLIASVFSQPIADIVAFAATLNDDGIVNIPGASGFGVFSMVTEIR